LALSTYRITIFEYDWARTFDDHRRSSSKIGLSFRDASIHRASPFATSLFKIPLTIDANIGIDDILICGGRDGLNRALLLTGATVNALCGDHVRHR
jgi:hypothetical protein